MDLIRFQEILISHHSRYPLSQIEDFYKLAHQAALGSEHAVKDLETARNWLANEIDELEGISTEPLIDPISPNCHILRIHLQPYMEIDADPEDLLRAFVHTANDYKGSVESLIKFIKVINLTAESGDILFQKEEVKEFLTKMESLSFPAVHHSPNYINNYRPHYRVVARKFLPDIIMAYQ